MGEGRGCGTDSLVAGMVAVVVGIVVGSLAVTLGLPRILT